MPQLYKTVGEKKYREIKFMFKSQLAACNSRRCRIGVGVWVLVLVGLRYVVRAGSQQHIFAG